jgi:hypothetical protein
MSLSMSHNPLLDSADAGTTARMARLLHNHRKDRGWSTRRLSKLSNGAWSARDLKLVEEGRWPLDQANFAELAALYEVDATAVLPSRTPLVIDKGLISIGAMASTYSIGNLDSLLKSYLLLVRRMRGQQRVAVVDLRRADLEILSAHLELSAEEISGRLGELMGVTAAQRSSMSSMFTTGTAVIVLTTSDAVAAATEAPSRPESDEDAVPSGPYPMLADRSEEDEWSSSAIDDLASGDLLSPIVTDQD